MDFTDVLNVLDLKKESENAFLGDNIDIPSNRVYGGQLLGQSIMAAARTTSDFRLPSSIHANFINAGVLNQKCRYDVTRLKDGTRISHRRVTCSQSNSRKPIFEATVRFNEIEQSDFDFDTFKVGNIPAPEDLKSISQTFSELKKQNRWTKYFAENRAFETKQINPNLFLNNVVADCNAKEIVWFRSRYNEEKGVLQTAKSSTSPTISSDQLLSRALLAFFTDQFAFAPALRKAGLSWLTPNSSYVSLDHTQHFYRETNLNDWHLFVGDSPIGTASRGLGAGCIYNNSGKIISTYSQEGYFQVN